MNKQRKAHRVHIVNKDGIGYTTKITDAETGEDIPGVFQVALITIGNAITAQIQAYASFDIVVSAEVTTICPSCQRPLEERGSEESTG